MVSVSAIQNALFSVSYESIVIEALVGLALNSVYDAMTEEEKKRIIDNLDKNDIDGAAEVIEQVDEEHPDKDFEERLHELIRELNDNQIEAEDPHEAGKQIQRQLGSF